MCALAELLHSSGAKVSGSDTGDVFYTDEILKELGIPYYETFDGAHVPAAASLVIHSAAYDQTNPEVAEALRRAAGGALGGATDGETSRKQKLRVLKYTDALGEYSANLDSTGIAGVHGKTTTTALAGTLIRAVRLPAQVLAGSAVSTFNGHSTVVLGDKYFVAETCEYRKHFLSFRPRRIILTSVESDHQDFFPTYQSIREAFVEYVMLLPENGELIYCADDAGAVEVVNIIKKKRSDLSYTEYGFNAAGGYKIESCAVQNGRTVFKLRGFETPFELRVPGVHNVLNSAAALALLFSLLRCEHGGNISAKEFDGAAAICAKALGEFCGCKRRSEILGEVNGILFMDDYAHHPTAIKTTLAGIKEFYPARRLVVSFMSHTYTRTAALFDSFAAAFTCADVLLLHKIYASARETYSGGVNGETLFNEAKKYHNNLYYFDEYFDAIPWLKENLKPGDIFLTLGAGDNWLLGKKMFEEENAK
jgi:UDP-N-acetylmuramate--alanine ligase